MKIQKFEFQFDVHHAVFNAGSVISGNLYLNLSSPMKMRSISLFFEGKGKAYWDVRSGKHTTKYRGHETYLNHRVVVYGRLDGSQTEHPAGSHAYPFSLMLNQNVPSSFEGRRGYVRYTCKATIDRPWKFDESYKKAFTVIHHLDLNYVQNALSPIIGQQEETIQGCCCEEGKVKVVMNLNKSAYVPGEPIVYDINIENNSENDITDMTLILRQDVTYTGKSDSLFSSGNPHYHTKVDTFNLFNGSFVVRKSKSDQLNRASIVPSLPPSRLEGCNIIDIVYHVILKVPCGWTTIKIERSILIGTIPAHMAPVLIQPQPYNPSAPTAPSAPLEFSAIPSSPPPPINEPPPSYAECVFGRVQIHDENDDEHTAGERSWAPAYPYYDWSAHNSQMFGGQIASVPQYAPPPYDD